MAGLAGNPVIGTVDLYTSNADQGNTALGQLIFGDSGKAFRYVKAGAAALVVGNVLQSQAVDTQFTNMAVASNTAAGSTTIPLTNGTTVVVADEFKYGTLSVYTTPGLGEEYTVLGNSAGTNGGALSVIIDRPLRTAITSAATKMNLRWSPWYKVVQGVGTTLTGTAVGVAVYPIAIGEFGWVQTKGVGAVLSDATSILVGSALMPSATAAGSAALAIAGFPIIGQAMQAGASGHDIAVQLSID